MKEVLSNSTSAQNNTNTQPPKNKSFSMCDNLRQCTIPVDNESSDHSHQLKDNMLKNNLKRAQCPDQVDDGFKKHSQPDSLNIDRQTDQEILTNMNSNEFFTN